LKLMPLIFSKQLNITKIVIDHPEMTLLRNREGVWNSPRSESRRNQGKKRPARGERECGQVLTWTMEPSPSGPSPASGTHRIQQGRHSDEQFSFTTHFPWSLPSAFPAAAA